MKMIYLAGAFVLLLLFGMYDVCGKDIVWTGFRQGDDLVSEAGPEKWLHDDMILFDESEEMFGVGDDENNFCDQDSHHEVATFFGHENIRRNIQFFAKAIVFIGVAALVVGVFFLCCQQSSKCQEVNEKLNNSLHGENTDCLSQPSFGHDEYNENGNGGDADHGKNNHMLPDYDREGLVGMNSDCFDEYLFNTVVEQFENICSDDFTLMAISSL